MAIERVNVSTGQVPTEADWEDWLNRAIDKLNAGIAPADLVKNVAGKVEISITGDADTVDGLHASEIIAGDFPEVKKTLIDLITGGSGLVLRGGVATKNATTANQLDITACTVIQKVTSTGYINRVDLPAAFKITTLANTTYYLDVVPDAADYSWGTAHPADDYVTLATVTTDASANIATVLDTRPLTATLLNGFDGKIIVPGANVSGDISGEAAATQANLNTHKTATILDHPDGSVIAVKLAPDAAVANIGYTPVNKAGDTMTGNLSIAPAGNAGIELGRTDDVSSTPFIDFHSGATAVDYDSRIIASGGTGVAGGGTLDIKAANVTINANEIWHAGNDGAESGLDADLLCGVPGITIASMFKRVLSGADGDVTISSDTVVPRNLMAYNNLTINNGYTLTGQPGVTVIGVKNILTLDGTLKAENGGAGGASVYNSGAGGAGGGSLVIIAKTIVGSGTIDASGAIDLMI